jgi:hypothetical protein
MNVMGSFTNFNFTGVWQMGASYPEFQATPSGIHYIFFTDTLYDGDLETAGGGATGLEGADLICQAAGDSGTSSPTGKKWRALITSASANGFYAQSRVWFFGEVQDVFDNTVTTDPNVWPWVLTNAVTYTEDGNSPPSYIWTGSNSSGKAVGAASCTDWTSNLGAETAEEGYGPSSTSTWIDNTTTGTCDTSRAIYCVSE